MNFGVFGVFLTFGLGALMWDVFWGGFYVDFGDFGVFCLLSYVNRELWGWGVLPLVGFVYFR